MKFTITDKAKEKLSLMQEQNIPIMLYNIPVGWNNFTYKIVSVKQTQQDNVHNVDGINIIVPKELERSLISVKIDYGGIFTKDFRITPRYS